MLAPMTTCAACSRRPRAVEAILGGHGRACQERPGKRGVMGGLGLRAYFGGEVVHIVEKLHTHRVGAGG